ncbi:uncharacterized protein ARMOST_17769 [Armillaria ostoyae]|uniref:Uncharacterized protein n=1 Tax=Armillaria ostoyae TaxID=47428 RepID=A0A284RZX4_ARMOS|nr:uncharacterized protein ARMOST_17769 [Armillaria ostoyae]
MAEALGIASSILTLVDVSWTIFEYLKDVKEASKERDRLSKELFGLVYWLNEVTPLTDTTEPNDLWLVTMQRLSGPIVQLTALLDDLTKEFELAPSGTTEKVTEPGTEKVKSGLLEKVKVVKHRLLWKFKKESVEDALEKIERIKSLMIVAVQRDHFALSQAINEILAIVDTKVEGVLDCTNRIEQVTQRVDMNIFKICDQVAHINNGVSHIQSQGQKTEDGDLLMSIITWLTDLNFKSVQAEKLSQRVGDTGHWFLKSKLFKEWVDGMAPSLCLWCPGNPGVGKTILTAIIIDYLQSLNHERKTLILSIFCDYQSATAQTIPNLLCSLLKQLVQDNGLLDPITLLYNQCHHDGTQPSLDVLTKILLQEFKSFHHVYVVLDALDEFADNQRKELVEKIRSLGDNIHLLVTSRDIPKIGLLFKEDAKLDIRAVEADITTFVADKLSRGDLADLINGDDNLHQTIITGVAEKARGMFLLASLHMDSLAQSTNQKTLRDALKELPDNMKNAYDETMERINHQGKHKSALASRVFGWIAFARRPLIVLELQHALAVELGTTTLNPDNLCSKDLLGSVCAGLVVIDQMGRHREPIVKFVHYTTQEYFMSQKDKFFPHFQETIMHTCLTYLLFNDSSDIDTYDDSISISSYKDGYPSVPYNYEYGIPYDLARKYPFLYYSLVNWGYHVNAPQHSMENEIVAFLDSACCRKVAKIIHAVELSTEVSVPLDFAVEYGLLHIMKVLLDRGDDLHQCKTPLLITAIQRGNLEMVKLLLDQDSIDPNACSFWETRPPLFYAIQLESMQILEMLLQSDRVNVNCRDCHGHTPLIMAVISGDISKVKVLLKHRGIDIWARDNSGNSAYNCAYWQLDSSYNEIFALLNRYIDRSSYQRDHYDPTYPTDNDLSNEQLNSNSGFRIPLDSSTTFPAEDLIGPPPCYDTNGAPIYVGSAIFRKSVHPCKIEPHLRVPCSVPYLSGKIAHTGRYDLLPFNPDTMEFVRTSRGRFPAGRKLVRGGYDEDGSPLYHGVTVYNGIKIPGKALTHPWAGCNITWGNAQHQVRSDYEILCWK